MQRIYKSLKLTGPKEGSQKVFSRANFFNSRIVTSDNFLYDITNNEVKYAVYKNNNSSTFYLKQSQIGSFDSDGTISVSGISINNEISFSGNQSAKGSLVIKDSSMPDVDVMKEKIKKNSLTSEENNIYANISPETSLSTYLFSDTALDNVDTEGNILSSSFNPEIDKSIDYSNDLIPFLDVQTNNEKKFETNILNLSNTTPTDNGYKFSESNENVIGFDAVKNNILSDKSVSKIEYATDNYILTVSKLTESDISNILKLTPNSKVYYKEYNSTTNLPTEVTNPIGIYIVREDDKFTIYTPELKEVEVESI